jgi:hypothetical protein
LFLTNIHFGKILKLNGFCSATLFSALLAVLVASSLSICFEFLHLQFCKQQFCFSIWWPAGIKSSFEIVFQFNGLSIFILDIF